LDQRCSPHGYVRWVGFKNYAVPESLVRVAKVRKSRRGLILKILCRARIVKLSYRCENFWEIMTLYFLKPRCVFHDSGFGSDRRAWVWVNGIPRTIPFCLESNVVSVCIKQWMYSRRRRRQMWVIVLRAYQKSLRRYINFL
jgi:hypothetical protein